MAGIPWFTTAPDAYAKTERQLRQLNALRGLTGVGGAILGNVRDLGNQEDQDNAAMQQLRERLGLQQDQAVQSAKPFDQQQVEGSTGTAAPQPLTTTDLQTGKVESTSWTPWDVKAPATSPEEAPTERPLGLPPPGAAPSAPAEYGMPTRQDIVEGLQAAGRGAKTVGRGALGALGTLGIAAGVLPNYPHGQRGMELARMRGRVERQADDVKRAQVLSHLISGSEDPGALLGRIAPTLGVRAGDVKLAPARMTGADAYLWETIRKIYPGDPQAQLTKYEEVKAKYGGGRTGNPNIYAVIEAKQSDDPKVRAKAEAMWQDIWKIEQRRHPTPFEQFGGEAEGGEGGVPPQSASSARSSSGFHTSRQGKLGPEAAERDQMDEHLNWNAEVEGRPGSYLGGPGGAGLPGTRPNPRIIEGIPLTR